MLWSPHDIICTSDTRTTLVCRCVCHVFAQHWRVCQLHVLLRGPLVLHKCSTQSWSVHLWSAFPPNRNGLCARGCGCPCVLAGAHHAHKLRAMVSDKHHVHIHQHAHAVACCVRNVHNEHATCTCTLSAHTKHTHTHSVVMLEEDIYYINRYAARSHMGSCWVT